MNLALNAVDTYNWFEKHGNTCAKQTTMAVLIDVHGRGYFGFNECARPQSTCPRGTKPTGVGYDLCDEVCQQVSHAEVAAVRAAGPAANGGVLYLFGHNYVCDNCLRIIRNAGVVAYLCFERKENKWYPATRSFMTVPSVFPTS